MNGRMRYLRTKTFSPNLPPKPKQLSRKWRTAQNKAIKQFEQKHQLNLFNNGNKN